MGDATSVGGGKGACSVDSGESPDPAPFATSADPVSVAGWDEAVDASWSAAADVVLAAPGPPGLDPDGGDHPPLVPSDSPPSSQLSPSRRRRTAVGSVLRWYPSTKSRTSSRPNTSW